MDAPDVFQADITITDPVGLHARPAAVVVKTAGRYQAKVKIKFGNKQADARSIIQLLGLGVRQGSPVTVVAEGDDAEEAVKAVLSVLAGE
jgi:phosphotransferase system HPr (HPr) family protein